MAKSPEKLSILNASLERAGYEPKADHIQERIPGSIFFDLTLLSDHANPIPLMIPPLEQFIYHMKDMDIRKSDHIICYDKSGMLSSPRVYWMFKVFGANNVYILNGTFEKWKAEKRKIESGENEHTWKQKRQNPAGPQDYDYKLNKALVIDHANIKAVIEKDGQAKEEGKDKSKELYLLDSRFEKVYSMGHIPSSQNIPFTDVLNKDKTFKDKNDLIDLFKKKGIVDPAKDKIIVSC